MVLPFFFHDPDALLEHVESNIHLLLADDQRRSDADRILPGSQIQNAALESQLDYAVTLIMRPRPGLLVLDDLHAHHQSAAAHVAYHGMLLHPGARPLHDAIAHGGSVAHA